MKIWNEDKLDKWRECYDLVIPSLVAIIYIVFLMLIRIDILDFKYITESDYFPTMLESIITFISIVIGVFGFLLPLFISSKDELSLINYFIDNIDKKIFSFKLRMIIISGFVTVFISCLLFFFDIYDAWFLHLLILLWIWVLLYFMLNSYRFISLLVRLFVEDREEPGKKQKDPMSKIEEEELVKHINDINKGTK